MRDIGGNEYSSQPQSKNEHKRNKSQYQLNSSVVKSSVEAAPQEMVKNILIDDTCKQKKN
jgi:hypothetical protein